MSELVAEVDVMKIDDSVKESGENQVEKTANEEGDDGDEEENDEDEDEGEAGTSGKKKKKKKKKKKPKKKKAGGAASHPGAAEPCQPQVHRLLTGEYIIFK